MLITDLNAFHSLQHIEGYWLPSSIFDAFLLEWYLKRKISEGTSQRIILNGNSVMYGRYYVLIETGEIRMSKPKDLRMLRRAQEIGISIDDFKKSSQ